MSPPQKILKSANRVSYLCIETLIYRFIVLSLRYLTSSRSTQFVPFPVNPVGQLPHLKKGGSSHGRHCTPTNFEFIILILQYFNVILLFCFTVIWLIKIILILVIKIRRFAEYTHSHFLVLTGMYNELI